MNYFIETLSFSFILNEEERGGVTPRVRLFILGFLNDPGAFWLIFRIKDKIKTMA